MRLLIVEEALKDRRGHWYEYNRAIVAEARRRGVETTVLAHADLQEDLRRELGAKPFFPVTSWDHVYYHPAAWRRYLGILRHNLLVARLVGAYLADAGPFDVVLVPTVVLYHWLAWRWIAWRGKGRWFGRLVLTTRNNAGEYDPATRRYRFTASARVLRRIVGTFRSPVRGGVVELASDSGRLAAQYEAQCGVPLSVYPHPVDDDLDARRPRGRDPSAPLTFGALGPPRFEKGSDLILEAARLLRNRHPAKQVRFLIQWSGECHDPLGRLVAPGADLEGDANVTLVTSDLSTAQYRQRLAECDVLLLPYRRAQYHARLSGVAVEAFRSGIPCICVSDTWIADSMALFGAGVAIEEESAEALAEAIARMAGRYDEYAALAIGHAEAARRFHSAEAFVERLLRTGSAS